jgi:hypothetical protein
MCDVASTAVCFSESIGCFPGMASKFFFKPLVTIPVASITTGMSHVLYYYYSTLNNVPIIITSIAWLKRYLLAVCNETDCISTMPYWQQCTRSLPDL